MDRSVEIELIEDLLGLQAQTSPFLDVQCHRKSLERHYSPDIFRREQAQISVRLPQIIAHSSAPPRAQCLFDHGGGMPPSAADAQ
ncbi:hypothetical protein [Halioglobus sp. HI00S01]|uniref:hypothetical protein n=1 Tax=Halioglobus sp. HI00S01 TaxID=1822214 RepID=UPI0018D2C251|nr:hypothetical protein [Halioglobus sp. HI00S01]